MRAAACCLFSLAVTGLYLWRKHFVLNNVIAVCTAVSLITLVEVGAAEQIRSFRFGFLMMVFMFAYDLLWVFYSKEYFGLESSAQTGSNVEVPFKLALARLVASPYTSCSRINLGDVIIPAMMVRFMRLADRKRRDRQSAYFWIAMGGYFLAMGCWTLWHALFLKVHPPFIFITPFMFVPLFLYSALSHDLLGLWDWVYQKQRPAPLPGEEHQPLQDSQRLQDSSLELQDRDSSRHYAALPPAPAT